MQLYKTPADGASEALRQSLPATGWTRITSDSSFNSQPHSRLQTVYEASYAGGEDAALTAAMLQRLAEKDAAFYGAPISPTMVASKSTTAGMVKDIKFLDTETCFWQLALQQLQQFKASSGQGIPMLSEPRMVHDCWLQLYCEGSGSLLGAVELCKAWLGARLYLCWRSPAWCTAVG